MHLQTQPCWTWWVQYMVYMKGKVIIKYLRAVWCPDTKQRESYRRIWRTFWETAGKQNKGDRKKTKIKSKWTLIPLIICDKRSIYINRKNHICSLKISYKEINTNLDNICERAVQWNLFKADTIRTIELSTSRLCIRASSLQYLS